MTGTEKLDSFDFAVTIKAGDEVLVFSPRGNKLNGTFTFRSYVRKGDHEWVDVTEEKWKGQERVVNRVRSIPIERVWPIRKAGGDG